MKYSNQATQGKMTKWRSPALTEEQQEKVAKAMEAQVARKGGVSEDNVAEVVRCRAVERLLQGSQIKAADASWAWIAQEQHAGRITHRVTRKLKGSSYLSEPYWQAAAQLRAGWGDVRMAGISEQQLAELQQMLKVKEALMRQGTMPEEGEEKEDSEEYEERDPMKQALSACNKVIMVTPAAVEATWQSIKHNFNNRRQPFWTCIGLLMMEGHIQGPVGAGSREGRWWEEASSLGQALGAAPVREKALGMKVGSIATAAKMQVAVGVDLMAGTQSGRQAMEAEGLMYVPMDKEEWVFSALERTWVQNVVCDLLVDSPEVLLQKVREMVEGWFGKGQEFSISGLWASPDCRTFTKCDATNRSKGCGYRDHSKDNRPPLQSARTKYGKMAREADLLVKGVLKVIKQWNKRFKEMRWCIENPVGSLAKREYMQEGVWRQPRQLREIHYCAYGHPYHKPTHIWTNNLLWEPEGDTGTGQCERRCQAGGWSQTGRWKHTYGIARESDREIQGKGRQAWKNMVPQQLHKELWRGVGALMMTAKDKRIPP